MRTRVLVGSLLLLAAAGILVGDQYLAPWFPILLVVLLIEVVFGGLELVRLVPPASRPHPTVIVPGVVVVLLANWVHVAAGGGSRWEPVLFAFILVFLVAFLVEMVQYREPGTAVPRLALTLFTVAYLGLLASFLAQLRWLDAPERSVLLLATVVFVPKAGDIGAFFTGTFLGRHKMSPLLSPKKTWEGLTGGLLFAALTAVGIGFLGPVFAGGIVEAVAFGVVIGLVGAIGDLAESLIKRDGAVKDASAVIPGFGGLLDVIDSIYFAAPVAYLWFRVSSTMSDAATRNLTLDSREEAVILFGPRDQFLRTVRDALGVRIVARGDVIQIDGPADATGQAERAFQQLRLVLRKHGKLTPEDVRTVIEVVRSDTDRGAGQAVTTMESGRHLRPRTDGQGRYVQAMKAHELVICVGPAGTGKTYLAVGFAVGLLRSGQVKKIVLVRPAVEAGERLGFLPGDMAAKVNPYLRPLFDALNDIMEPDQVRRYMEHDIIEIAPLAFMRGRTLNQACIIMDEGQNATVAQTKMFLTRMGNNSRVIVTGDLTQTDLPKTVRSGLADAVQRLKDVEGLAVVHLTESDIVRNPLVSRIVAAYEDEHPRRRKS